MTSVARRIAVSLLCGMIAIGHAPAWLHIAGCGQHGHHALAAATVTAEAPCSHGCSHQPEGDSSAGEHGDQAPAEEASLPTGHDHEHSSDSCVLCQSLASVTGVQSQTASVIHCRVSLFESDIVDTTGPIATPLLDPQPRGPPAIVA